MYLKWELPSWNVSPSLPCLYHVNIVLHIFFFFQKRLEGTKVTVESFMAWKRKFDEERLALKAKVKKEVLNDKDWLKILLVDNASMFFFQDLGLTGKEQFLNNADIDLAPIGGGDGADADVAAAAVAVDESLFEDLDDLDVGDSDLDDDSDR